MREPQGWGLGTFKVESYRGTLMVGGCRVGGERCGTLLSLKLTEVPLLLGDVPLSAFVSVGSALEVPGGQRGRGPRASSPLAPRTATCE